MDEPLEYGWRGPLGDTEMIELIRAHGETAAAGWWDCVQQFSLGWVTARLDGALVGFVNVAWDGGNHAFLIDTKVASAFQRRGIATELVRRAEMHARSAGCEWLHVDFRDELTPFYLDACGFRSTPAGLIRLRTS